MNNPAFGKAESSGVYFLAAERRPAVEAAARQAQLRLLPATVSPLAPGESLLAALGTAWQLPDWYGANFDALYDCLADPDWLPATGHVLLLDGMRGLRAKHSKDLATLVDVLRAVATARAEAGQPFFALLDAPARGVPALPDE